MTVAAVVIVPEPPAALAPADGEPALRRVAQAAWSGGALPTVIVAPEASEDLRRAAADLGVTLTSPGPDEPRGIAWFVHGMRAAVAGVARDLGRAAVALQVRVGRSGDRHLTRRGARSHSGRDRSGGLRRAARLPDTSSRGPRRSVGRPVRAPRRRSGPVARGRRRRHPPDRAGRPGDRPRHLDVPRRPAPLPGPARAGGRAAPGMELRAGGAGLGPASVARADRRPRPTRPDPT